MKEEELKVLIDLWYESTYGHYKKCEEKHYELMQKLRKLYNKFYDKNE